MFFPSEGPSLVEEVPFSLITRMNRKENSSLPPTNVWILSEEPPKPEVLTRLVTLTAQRLNQTVTESKAGVRLLPLAGEGNAFSFTYEIVGLTVTGVNRLFFRLVTSPLHVVDYQVFVQDLIPTQTDKPLFYVEEARLSDNEKSGLFTRLAKWALLARWHPDAKDRVLLFTDTALERKFAPTLKPSFLFCLRLIKTLGIAIQDAPDVIGDIDAFDSVKAVIDAKNALSPERDHLQKSVPMHWSVPVRLHIEGDTLIIRAWLEKGGTISHEANISLVGSLAMTVRHLGWTGKITVTDHGVVDDYLIRANKFHVFQETFGVELEDVESFGMKLPRHYWTFEKRNKKQVTIFLACVVPYFGLGKVLFSHHNRAEKTDFLKPNGQTSEVRRYVDLKAHREGVDNQRIDTPDLCLINKAQDQALILNAQTWGARWSALNQLPLMANFEAVYINRFYPNASVENRALLFGSKQDSLPYSLFCLLLNDDGKLIVHDDAPQLIKDAVNRLHAFWEKKSEGRLPPDLARFSFGPSSGTLF